MNKLTSLTLTALLLTPLAALRAADQSEPVSLGPPPGVVVAASPNSQRVFVFSPSIAILPDGNYIVSYDTSGNSVVKASGDRGATWKQLAELPGQKWSTLFVHRGGLYLIGVSSTTGSMVIRRSTDSGRTWTEPRDGKSGLLATGHFHCGPTPVLVHDGRVWRAFEEFAPTEPTRHFSAFVMSAPEDADLLTATNWTRSNQIALRHEWLNTRNEEWLEGNVVVTPAGSLVDILRVESYPATDAAAALPGAAATIPRYEVAAMMDIARDGRRVTFDLAHGFIHFIGSESKFTIRYDPVSRRYWTLGNKITNLVSGADWTHSPHHQRNVLALTSSTDLREWTERYRMLSYAAGSVVEKKGSRVGFQYVDWQFDGNDIIAVCRTSWDGANYHDSNYITFHRIKNFRTLTPANSPPDLPPLAALHSADAPQLPRPKLQIINGSNQTIDVFWLKSDADHVANGSVEPGKDAVITTTLGHRFEIVGRDDKTTVTVTSEVPVQAFRFDPRGRNGVPSFYTQSVSANGFPIVASAKVNPFALQEAAYLVNIMLAKHTEVRTAMIKSGARLCITAYNEFTTDLPEFARLAAEKVPGFEDVSAKDYWDARARGLGGSETDPYCTVGEENLLRCTGDPFAKESILIHEFAHNIHLRGMVNVDPTFDARVNAAYAAAMKAGLWKGKYASVNHHEYFAVGTASWFGHDRFNDFDHNHVHLRAQLIEYDPGLAALCREVFGDAAPQYTKPATRLTGHLAGYDPATAPTFVWPERLQQAQAEIHAKAVARDKAANGDNPR